MGIKAVILLEKMTFRGHSIPTHVDLHKHGAIIISLKITGLFSFARR